MSATGIKVEDAAFAESIAFLDKETIIRDHHSTFEKCHSRQVSDGTSCTVERTKRFVHC